MRQWWAWNANIIRFFSLSQCGWVVGWPTSPLPDHLIFPPKVWPLCSFYSPIHHRSSEAEILEHISALIKGFNSQPLGQQPSMLTTTLSHTPLKITPLFFFYKYFLSARISMIKVAETASAFARFKQSTLSQTTGVQWHLIIWIWLDQ